VLISDAANMAAIEAEVSKTIEYLRRRLFPLHGLRV